MTTREIKIEIHFSPKIITEIVIIIPTIIQGLGNLYNLREDRSKVQMVSISLRVKALKIPSLEVAVAIKQMPPEKTIMVSNIQTKGIPKDKTTLLAKEIDNLISNIKKI